jgi:hypothetical protein
MTDVLSLMFKGERKTSYSPANTPAIIHSSTKEQPKYHRLKDDLGPYMSIDYREIGDERGSVVFTIKGIRETGNEWLIKPPALTERLIKIDGIPALNGAGEEFKRRENYIAVKKAMDSEKLHREYVLFTLTNWYLLRKLFYLPDSQADIYEQKNNLVFGEVSFEDIWLYGKGSNWDPKKNAPPIINCGQADILSWGPGGLTIFELTANQKDNKSEQLSRHRRGVEKIIREFNHGSDIPINIYVGKISFDPGDKSKANKIMDIRLLDNPMVSQYEKAPAVHARTKDEAIKIFHIKNK